MKQSVTLFALVLAVLFSGSVFGQKKNTAKPVTHQVGIIAHRGFHKYDQSAENSISSMQNAIDHDFYGTEFDVQITGDNIAILYHDNNLQGLPIEELPLQELQNHPAYILSNGEPIPTLKSFFEACNKALLSQQTSRHTTTRLFYEIKPTNNPDKLEFAISSACDMVKQYQLFKNIVFISFSIDACKMLHDRLPEVTIAYLGGDLEPVELHNLGINALDYNYSILLKHSEWIGKAHDLGMTVIAWTVNDKQTAVNLQALGVDYITTDVPLDATEWMNH